MKTDTEIKSIWSNSQNDICYSIIYIINGKKLDEICFCLERDMITTIIT